MWKIEKWTENEYKKFLQYLLQLQDMKFHDFHQKLIPGVDNLIGIPVPVLRKIALEIAKGNYMEFISCMRHEYYEEAMIQGLLIGTMPVNTESDLELLIKQVDIFSYSIDNWAVCDIFCGEMKIIKKFRERFWVYLQPCFLCQEEYRVRMGVVILLNYYLETDYIDRVLKICDKIHRDNYYINMAISWLLSSAFVKQEEKTRNYLCCNHLNPFTYQKTLQKIIESNRVTAENKKWAEERKKM